MTIEHSADGRPVEQVSNSDEGRLAYIADMAAELATMASEAGEAHLASMLGAAAHEAARPRARRMHG